MLNEKLKIREDAEYLVREYITTKNESLKERIIKSYINLIKHIVGRLHIPENWILKKEDLYQYGIIGLLEALERYNLSYGVSFKTFAYKRIYGEIIDAIRRETALNRGQVKSIMKLNDGLERLRSKLKREPTVEEICKEVNISEEEYFKIQQIIDIGYTLSLDDKLYKDGEDSIRIKDRIVDPDQMNPEEKVEFDDLKSYLKNIIKELDERERLILALYFYEELTLADIGLVLGVSESRVSQILNETLRLLRKKVEERNAIR
ncbi:MAG: FliA/WhiG family RNA polymerase sigma factor [Candidatus Marinimicrobia bacterium]|nr:FliA/WhiG family RNA polymerase sigma factor [Candidatus Neomarinimicrobiota bacterium]